MEKLVKILAVAVAILFAGVGYHEYQKAQTKKAEKLAYEAKIAAKQAEERKKAMEAQQRQMQAEKEEAEVIERAKTEMANVLKDPDSAQYRNITVGQKSKDKAKYVCGQVNSKNAMGGYVGYKDFVYVDGDTVFIANDNTMINEFVNAICSK